MLSRNKRKLVPMLICLSVFVLYIVTKGNNGNKLSGVESSPPPDGGKYCDVHDFRSNLNTEDDLQFQCVSTTTSPNVRICIYPLSVDVVSDSIRSRGRWENDIVQAVSKVLKLYPASSFIDIGANIGIYSLVMARLGYNVVAVEPKLSSIMRIHKSVNLNKLSTNVVLVKNAISDTRIQVTLYSENTNQAGSSIRFTMANKETVQSIIMDDLMDVIHGTEAVLKIDIQGSECEALLESTKLFYHISIHAIFMEWEEMAGFIKAKAKSDMVCLSKLVPYLRKLGYTPWPMDTQYISVFGVVKLRDTDMKYWPANIVWMTSSVRSRAGTVWDQMLKTKSNSAPQNLQRVNDISEEAVELESDSGVSEDDQILQSETHNAAIADTENQQLWDTDLQNQQLWDTDLQNQELAGAETERQQLSDTDAITDSDYVNQQLSDFDKESYELFDADSHNPTPSDVDVAKYKLPEIQTENHGLSGVDTEHQKQADVDVENYELTNVGTKSLQLTEDAIENEQLLDIDTEQHTLSTVVTDKHELSDGDTEKQELLIYAATKNQELSNVDIENNELSEVDAQNIELAHVGTENQELSNIKTENYQLSNVDIETQNQQDIDLEQLPDLDTQKRQPSVTDLEQLPDLDTQATNGSY